MIGRNSEGDVTFTVDDRDELVSSFKELLTSTDVGRNYKTNFYTKERSDEDASKIVGAAQQIAGGPSISIRHLTRALEILLDAGEIQPKNIAQAVQLSEPEPDTRPRGRNGKPLTDSQLRWQEYNVWSATAGSEDRKRRMASDPDYASFVRKSLRDEMVHEIDGAVVPAGQPTTKARASQELVRFAQNFLKEPSYNLRPKNGMVSLAGEQITWPAFNELVDKATAARLL